MTRPETSIEESPGGAVIAVLVVPGASRSEITGPHGDVLRLRVAAAPEKGRANREAEKLLEEFFGTKVELVSGARSRRKRFLLQGASAATISRRIQQEWG